MGDKLFKDITGTRIAKGIENIVDAQVHTELALQQVLRQAGVHAVMMLDLALRRELVGYIETIHLEVRGRGDRDVHVALHVPTGH